ncbi:MAG: sulfotransferase family protein [Acidimicrobiales bacterium]|nr:MAG: sulfotransferase family protein [Acidimicrobiales bacterium]
MGGYLRLPPGAFPALADEGAHADLVGPHARGEEQPVKVLFVVSSGRSGSTVIDRMLGQFPGVWGAGEISWIWESSLLNNGRCGCGAKFHECPQWNKVFDLLGGMDAVDAEAMVAFWRRDDKMLGPHFPRLLSRSGRRSIPEFTDAARVLELLMAAMRRVASCRVIVDTTKNPFHYAYLQKSPVVDPYLLLLLRDPRAVAYSWARPKKELGYDDGRPMPREPLVKSALWWDLIVQFTSMFGRDRPERFMVLRYEEFVEAPRRVLDEIGEFCGEKWDWSGVEVPGADDEFRVGLNHSVWGNPMRFSDETLRVRPDERWKAMPPGQKAVVAALCAPWMLRTGYLGSGSRSGSRGA